MEDKLVVPSHLSAEMKEFWIAFNERWDCQEHHLLLLQGACEAFDQAQAARAVLEVEGAIVETGAGGRKAHPAGAIYRDSMQLFNRLMFRLGPGEGEPHIERPTGYTERYRNQRRRQREAATLK
jgi:phage terminase small subunit